MKLLYTLLVFILLVSCKSISKTNDSEGTASIIGRWELRQAQNGMVPTKDYPAGNGNRYQFTADGYEIYDGGTKTKSGKYKVVKDTTVSASTGLSLPQGQFTDRIIFDNDTTADKIFIEVSNNELTTLTGYFPVDGGSRRIYRKVENN